MSKYHGEFSAGQTTYQVYESNTPVVEGKGRPQGMTLAKLSDLFVVDGIVGSKTTIWKDDNCRLDKQNNVGTVRFSGHNVDGFSFNNLSLQVADKSCGVLYIQSDFAGINGEDVAAFRAPFTALKTNKATSNEVRFLRILYTWLWVSYTRNRKMCITTATNFTVTGAKVVDSGNDVTQAKTSAKTNII